MGAEVYRPIGREWYDQGFWKVYDHPATVEQFLGIGGNTPDGSAKLNEVTEHPDPEIYHCQDIDSGYYNKAITLKGFLERPFDIVIASIPHHVEPFKKLCALHPNKPKLIFQIGNAWTVEAAMAPNIMASAIIHDVPPEINFISYHQEFDTNIFSPEFNYPEQNIYSFVNCFDIAPHFSADWQLFTQVEKQLSKWNFKVYGGQCRDGVANGAKEVAAKMKEARFIWHTKNGGDGYGHVIHNVPAVGRPLIVKKQYYVDKLAEPLLVDGQTCICIDNLDCQQIVDKINYYSEPARYEQMCRAAFYNFKKVVDFEREQKIVEEFIQKLV